MTTANTSTVAPVLIQPSWAAPASVVALVTTRLGGVSKSPFNTFNLALHVKDNPVDVTSNRALLQELLGAPLHLQWLEQVHGTQIVHAEAGAGERCGDAVFVDTPGLAGVVMTADCLPVFLAARDGRSVAVAHAGWRGLADGILERTLSCFAVPASEVIAWLGPAIGPCHFEVGAEVREIFLNSTADPLLRERLCAEGFRLAESADKYLADLYALARLKLLAAGVASVSGGGWCTHCDASRFYSYRREGVTGRMASVIGLRPGF
ncbi:MAG: peptidoglycan editing factor PgeF [Pseudomonadota bacterium]